MWEFIKTYLSRVKGPLFGSILATFYMFMIACGSPALAIVLTYPIATYMLIYRLIPNILNRFNLHFDEHVHRVQLALHGVTALLVLASGFYIFPHYFLLFHALPPALTGTISTLTVFFTCFESSILVRPTDPDRYLGDDFSLIKMMFNPHVRLTRLYRKIMPRPPVDLILSDMERDALIERQNKALNQLPDHAHITQNSIDFIANLREDARDRAIKRVQQDYFDTLTPAQQACYSRYRELTFKLCPNIAMCAISLEVVTLDTQREFIMIEKRLVRSPFEPAARAVPVISRVFQRFSFDTARAQQPHDPKIAGTEDRINHPTKWNNQATEYKYHTYALVQNHALSLELCEAIENFNVSLGLAPGADSAVPRRSDAPVSRPASAQHAEEEVANQVGGEVNQQNERRRSPRPSSPGTNRYALTPPAVVQPSPNAVVVVNAEPLVQRNASPATQQHLYDLERLLAGQIFRR